MRLTRSSDHALSALMYLAGLDPDQSASGAAIAEVAGAGEATLLKIMRQLVAARLVRSQAGPRGGFRLNLPAEQISMLRVIEAVDGPLDSGTCTCMVEQHPCERKAWCSVHQVLVELQAQERKVLGATSIDRLRRDAEKRRDFVTAASEAVHGQRGNHPPTL